SSRRRHTRFSRDWCVDVCSSDLRMTQISTNYSSQRDFLNCWSNPTNAEYHALIDSNCLGSVDTIHQMVNDVQRVLDIKENADTIDRKSTRLNSSHVKISYAVFCL